MSARRPWLITIVGADGPGLAAWALAAVAELELAVTDIEQVELHGHLLLCVEVEATEQVAERVRGALATARPPGGDGSALEITVAPLTETGPRAGDRQLVTVLAPDLTAGALAALFGCVAASGGNMDRIARLSRYPVVSYELVVSGADPGALRAALGILAVEAEVDIALQRAGLHRRAKHLICLDADSTLLQGEVIDVLAARTPHGDQVVAITEAAMAGELDFTRALQARVALLAGMEVGVLAEVAGALVLTPGARTLIRTLKRLGYVTAVVSGGFVEVLGQLTSGLGIDHLAANRLEVADGRLTGRLVGPIIDRRGKAEALSAFAEAAGVPLAQTIAVGDGANDLDMLARAGLGIAFNAKPVVQGAADTALNVPYLDAILFLLGISREEIEAADREGGDGSPVPPPVAVARG